MAVIRNVSSLLKNLSKLEETIKKLKDDEIKSSLTKVKLATEEKQK